ncbi:hypothetical protein [Mesorhizobium sp. 113-3-3]|uniref:hypothetical protein n=1 Tax=Mesorhizobium sp. 113-3-3 TaxID=2744516 RepID=UPI00192530C4|nr:hypothetical protein [Mesorhizobium sp. 113-3-3]
MRRSWALLSMILFTGCATSPAPNFYNGAYYMAGDESCVRVQSISPTRVMCLNAKAQQTGYRDAMTDQQLMMYQQMRMQEQMIAQQQAATLAANNQAMAAATAMRYPQMGIPQVTPIARPGGNQVRCISTGIYTNCRAY